MTFKIGGRVKLKKDSQNVFPPLKNKLLIITYAYDGVLGFAGFDSQYWSAVHFEDIDAGCFVLSEMSE